MSFWSHLSNQGERCCSQYTFVNPFESDNANFTKSIFIMIFRPHGGPFEKMDFEIEVKGVRGQSGFFNWALRERNIQPRLHFKIVLKS